MTVNGGRGPVIVCGMYAFSRRLQDSWRALFDQLPPFLPECFGMAGPGVTVEFRHDEAAYREPSLLLGHTCGYPYLNTWRESHRPVAVAEFDVPGSLGSRYHSWLICRADDPRESLADFRGSVGAINNEDSNSGKNALRHAVRQYHHCGQFFREVIISGGHVESMTLIASGAVDLAAIDAITFHHARRDYPERVEGLRILGRTASSTALPFVQHRTAALPATRLFEALNEALENMPAESRNSLALKAFHCVRDSDYDAVASLKRDAIAAGYPEIR